ncbi:MAG: AAA family ATPase, partial [Acidimicrobiia bacterium]
MERATYTVFFTDIVGSTEQRSRLGDEVGDALRREHDTIVREATEAHGGEVVKGTGDGALVAFLGAAEALSCAIAIQQAIERRNRTADERLGLCVGVSLGDARYEDGDIHGTSVNEAARLCAKAGDGEIICSDVVRAVAGSRTDVEFRPLGSLELKGIPDPVAVSAVLWTPLDVEEAPGLPLPPDLEPGTRFLFAGRHAELEDLVARWKSATAGESGLVLIAGEPGVGKTRLSMEIARRAQEDDAVVLYGRCDDEIGVPYQPFVEALTFWIERVLVGSGAGALGRHGGELVRLVPHLADRVDDLPAPLSSDPETEQYRLFDAVASWLSAVAEDRALLLVLDDVHWAAKPTLLMLRHVARSSEGRLLVVATYRDTELERSHPLTGALADLRRMPDVSRIALVGLDESGVAELLESTAGHTLDESGVALARAIHAETEGNPFFVGEVLRHLSETGAIYEREGRWTTDANVAALGIPEGVREVIGRRLDRLSEVTNNALAHASVVGREFDLAMLGRLVELDDEAVIEALDDAIEARVIRETGIGRYTFSHALVRSALYDELRPTRRARLHRRVAEGIEAAHAPNLDRHLGELAHHYGRAGDTEKTVEYACRAGEHALAQLAHDEAAAHFDHARELLEDDEPDPRRLGHILLQLGVAQRRAGDGGYRDTLLRAAALAGDADDTELLAQAALANTRGFFSTFGATDEERVAVVRRALEEIGDSDRQERARLLANLVIETVFSEPIETREALSEEALELARRIGDAPTLAHVLVARCLAVWDPSTLVERLAFSEELVAVADQLADPYIQFFAAWYRFAPCVEAGRIAEAAETLERVTALAAELGQATPRWMDLIARSGQEVLRGDHERAEALAEEQMAAGEGVGSPQEPLFFYGVIVFAIRLDQGRAGEALPIAEVAAEQFGYIPGLAGMLAVTLCAVGREDEARALLDAAPRFRDIPWNQLRSSVLWGWTLVVAHLRDEARAAELYELLAPYEDQLVYNGLICFDSIASLLGALAQVLGRTEDAERHLDAAIEIATRIEAPGFL